MELKPEQLVAQLDTGPLRPAYLIAGAEILRVLEAADAVRAAARAQGIGEREVFEFEGRQVESDWDAVEASLIAPALFSPRRLIELRIPSGKPITPGAELIVRFCQAPPADVVLLVTANEWSKKHAGKWSEAIGRIGALAVAWPIKPHETADWIERRLRARGVTADRAAVQRLAERVEGNLLAAAQEIDKLALLMAQDRVSSRDLREQDSGEARAPAPGESAALPPVRTSMSETPVLTAELMEALVADAARFDVFRLIDAAMNGHGAQVSRMLAGLRAEGEAVPALLGMLVLELQRGAALARVAARGGNLGAEFRAQRVWESKQPMYRRALGRHGPQHWEAFLAQAGRVDRMAKGREPGDPWRGLERLLLALAEPRAARLLAAGG